METTIMENRMEKKMEKETDTREYMGVIILGLWQMIVLAPESFVAVIVDVVATTAAAAPAAGILVVCLAVD